MFFRAKKITINADTKASLRADRKISPPMNCDNHKNPVIYQLNCSGRTSRFTPKTTQASMTVEASLSFSLFLFFLVNVLSLIFLFIQYGERLEKLQQQGKQLAVYRYAIGDTEDGNNDFIRLTAVEEGASPFGLMAMPSVKLRVQCTVKPWTGYGVAEEKGREEEKEVVYMAKNGQVYHRNRGCTHLALSVKVISYGQVGGERNESGGRYSPCELCADTGFSGLAFVTAQGERYHALISCSGLRRTVRRVYLSDIPGVPECSKCG